MSPHRREIVRLIGSAATALARPDRPGDRIADRVPLVLAHLRSLVDSINAGEKDDPGQGRLFDESATVEPVVNATVTAEVERVRLGKKHHLILDRLRQGPVANTELLRFGMRSAARIHELRRAGYVIPIISRDHTNGVCIYALQEAR